jgi:hypothetical protein
MTVEQVVPWWDAAEDSSMPEEQTVMVYVRKGADDNERWLSFRPPASVDSTELLERGYALDGNQAIASISPQFEEATQVTQWWFPTLKEPNPTADYSWEHSLPDALRNAELALVAYFKQRNHRVIFR